MHKFRLDILDESPHHIVVFKPDNMVVVPGKGTPRPSLLDCVQKECGKNMRPVHRLDRVTSGCVIFAKDEFAERALSDAFKKNLVNKTYTAIVEGSVEQDSQIIKAKLLRVDSLNAKKGNLARQTIATNGQNATTKIKVLKRNEHFSLLEISPQSGKMHQIRIHLNHIGHPIVGDKLYGSKTPYKKNAIALVASKIDLPLPKGGRSNAQARNPSAFNNFLMEHLP